LSDEPLQQIIAELESASRGGERHSGRVDQKTGSQAATPKLDQLGITKMRSSRWQALAVKPRPIAAAFLAAGRHTENPSVGAAQKPNKYKG
jgi:hypothetical protein